MNKIISFIIPSYNVEQYLSRALDSFLLNKLQNKLDLQEKIEVIVVDDGSKDGTANIAEKYVKQNPNVFRLLKKENGGHGSAINEGTRLAIGKYLKIIDADDWIATENLPKLIEKLESCEADVVLNPFHIVNMQTGKIEVCHIYIKDFVRTYTLNDIMKNWQSFSECISFHGIMYKREFYEKYRHELPEKIFYEDQEYTTIPCCYAVTIQAMDISLYQYLIGNTEQSVAPHNQLKRIEHIRQIALRMLLYGKKNKNLSEVGLAYLHCKTEKVVLSYYVIANIMNSDKKNGRKWCRNLELEIRKLDFEFYKKVYKKGIVYRLLGLFHCNIDFYEKMVHSKLYNLLKKTGLNKI